MCSVASAVATRHQADEQTQWHAVPDEAEQADQHGEPGLCGTEHVARPADEHGLLAES